jgi:hypothetical protein
MNADQVYVDQVIAQLPRDAVLREQVAMEQEKLNEERRQADEARRNSARTRAMSSGTENGLVT